MFSLIRALIMGREASKAKTGLKFLPFKPILLSVSKILAYITPVVYTVTPFQTCN